ncbi:MAG: hypothetical protein ACYC61_15920 [Isosphaeraceae bacterium]
MASRKDRGNADQPQALRDWHRLFGLLLIDYFTGSPFEVELERDLSLQQQFLDVVIVRRGPGRFAGRLPDGLEGLVAHNLVTFKSHREAMDAWAVKELVSHYVAYRKVVSPSTSELVSEEEFRLFAVCARRPRNLPREVPWQERGPGVYDCLWGTDTIRVVVAGELPREAHNAPLHLFSASPKLVQFAGGSYQRRSEDTSELLEQLFQRFRSEGMTVSYTMKDFRRDYVKEHLPELSPREVAEAVRALPAETRRAVSAEVLLPELSPREVAEAVRALPAETRRAVSAEVLLPELSPREVAEAVRALPAETRRAVSAEVLQALPEEEIRQYLERASAVRKAPTPRPRRKK